jgi:Ca-activated chloride channel family protein
MTTNIATLPMIDTDLAASPGRRDVGRLVASDAEGKPRALPLAGVDIRARVADRVAEVEVRQRFVNDHAEAIEATYIFPLSGGCAISDFELVVAGRTVKGVLAEREEAREKYRRALDEGKRAAMLEQERSDVFTISVGNLPPGEEAAVRVVYTERLPFFEDGRTELRLPLVVAPRYIPGQPLPGESAGDGTALDTDQVPDASRITPPLLAPGFDPKTALALRVELLGTTAELACSQHAVSQRSSDNATIVSLSRDDERLDRDFVLRWRLAKEGVSPSLLCHTGPDGRVHGMVSVLAPRAGHHASSPRDVVFVLDRSGSMSGPKMASAARACGLLLRTLGPSDRFALLAFDNMYEWFGGQPQLVVADEDGLARGERWLREIEARGGTEIDGAVSHAYSVLDHRADAAGRQAAIVLVTDGQVGNENAVLGRVQKAGKHARVFAVGVDEAVNDAFIRRLAEAGGGTSALVAPGTALEEALVSIGRDIGHPVVTGLSIEGADGMIVEAGSLAPSRVADLFGGRATTIMFRANAVGPVRLRGTADDGSPFDVVIAPRVVDLPAIAHLWAREHLADLDDAFRLDPAHQDALRSDIVKTSIAYGVLTRFTAFLAVDDREAVAEPEKRRKIVQPVHLPAGWDAVKSAAPAMVAMPFAHGAMDRLSVGSHGPWATLGALFASQPDAEATPAEPDMLGALRPGAELHALIEDLEKEAAVREARPRVAIDRVRELRDKLAPLAGMLRGEAKRWIDELMAALDALLHALEERLRLDEAVRGGIERLDRVASEMPFGRPERRRRRFWE